MCSYFKYSRSGYHKSLNRKTEVGFREEVVINAVQRIRRFQPRIGGKKLYKLLQAEFNGSELGLGRDKFFDLLGRRGLLVKRRKKYAKTTQSWHFFHKYKNKLKNKKIRRAHQALVSDITYLRTKSEFMYLFLQTDAYSRMITGWHLSQSLGIEGALEALKMSLRQCPNPKGVIHHSDRGIQYCCKEYVKLLNDNEMTISMTEENHCYENAMAERVNGILKQEFLLDEVFKDKESVYKAVKQAIDSYNRLRPHWSLNLCTPMEVHQAA